MTLYAIGNKQPVLADDTIWIAPGAHVIGQVSLAPGVGIWFNAVLRGDNEPIVIGAGTNVQENTVMHTDLGFPLTIVLASRLGIPVSTTHILVGSVLGVGLARGIGALDLRVVGSILVSWVATLPIAATSSVGTNSLFCTSS